MRPTQCCYYSSRTPAGDACGQASVRQRDCVSPMLVQVHPPMWTAPSQTERTVTPIDLLASCFYANRTRILENSSKLCKMGAGSTIRLYSQILQNGCAFENSAKFCKMDMHLKMCRMCTSMNISSTHVHQKDTVPLRLSTAQSIPKGISRLCFGFQCTQLRCSGIHFTTPFLDVKKSLLRRVKNLLMNPMSTSALSCRRLHFFYDYFAFKFQMLCPNMLCKEVCLIINLKICLNVTDADTGGDYFEQHQLSYNGRVCTHTMG